jgi:RHS repeat-associated protein
LVTIISRTFPTITLTVPASTTTTAPQVRVTATDKFGLPNNTTNTTYMAHLDLKPPGATSFTTDYASPQTLKDGTTLFTLPKLTAGTGTYVVQARVEDLAGNQATSASSNIVLSAQPSPWAVTAQQLTVDPFDGQGQQQLGNVQVTSALDLDQSPGTSQSGNPQLVYNSDSVSVKPVIQVSIPTDTNSALPGSNMTVQLTWDGTAQTAQSVSFSGFSPGDVINVASQVSTAVTGTGHHSWSEAVTIPGHGTTTLTGTAYVAAEDSSPFGAGWTFSPVDKLVSIPSDSSGPAGMLRVYGTGEWRFFQGSGPYTSPAGDNGTLVKNMDGSFTYTTPDGRKDQFNSSGLLTSRVSADGQETLSFSYSGTTLTSMTAIDGAVTTFSYDGNNRVTAIATVQSRTTTLAFDSSGNLTQITNADAGLHTFAYDSGHRVTAETFGDLDNGWAYSTYGSLSTYTWGNPSGTNQSGSVTSITPASANELAAAVASPVPATVTDALTHATRYILDAAGRPREMDAADGGVSTWTRDTNGRVTVETDPLGRTTTYARDSAGYVTLETLPDGNTIASAYQASYPTAFHALTQLTDERGDVTTYAYDSSGHKTSETDALTETTTYGYNAAGEMTSETDANTHTTTFAFDSHRRLTLETNALSGTIGYAGFDSNYGEVQATTDELGHVTTTSFDKMDRLTGKTDALTDTESWTYDAAGLELSHVDALLRTENTTYDLFGRGLVSLVTDALSQPVQEDTLDSYNNDGETTGARDANGNWTTTTYDPVGRDTQTIDALGDVSLSAYDLDGEATATRDALGRWSSSAFNLRGWATMETDAAGDVTTTAYDAAGDATAVTDALTHTTTYQFDKLNRQTAMIDPLLRTSTTAFDKAGNETATIDPRGYTNVTAFDALNRATAVTDAAGTAHAQVTTTAYDAVGNETAVTDALTHTTSYVYDAVYRETEIHDGLNHVTTTGYDKVGNATLVEDALTKTTNYAFDALNRETAVTDPLTHTTTYLLDPMGDQVGSFDPLSDFTKSIYDPLERLIGTVDARGGLTQDSYDAEGNTIGVIDPVNNKTTFAVDALDRVTQEVDPAGGTKTTAYDAAGRVSYTIDRDGRTIVNSYDSADQLTSVVWKNAAGTAVNTLTYAYDNDGNLTSAGDNSGTYTMAYDEQDRLTSQTDPWGLTLTYSYDSAGRKTQVQDSKGGTLTSAYDNADRLTSQQLSATSLSPIRADLAYDNRDEMTLLTRYADLAGSTQLGTSAFSYDSAGRMTAVTHKNSSGATLSYYNDSFDNADRVTGETWASGTLSGAWTYTYDSTGELTNDGTHTWSYDLNGNRTNAGYTNTTENQLSTDGTWTYTYDPEGNLTQKTSGATTWTYGFDNANRMTSVLETVSSTTQVQVTYTYDIFNNRVQESEYVSGTGTTVTRHAYDGQNVWADLNTGNTVLTRYVYGDGVDQILARDVAGGQPNAGVAFYLTDRLGSVRDIMNTSQAIQDNLNYDGFGNPTQTNAAVGDRYEYTAREFDANTGLQYNRARYYNPGTGRWQSEDPSGFGGGDNNLYRYGQNGPTNRTDPSGLKVTKITIKEVKKPIIAKWGAFAWPVKFVLNDKADEKKGGWIFQHVKRSITDNIKGASAEEPQNYWEAWRVEPGKTGPKLFPLPKEGIEELAKSGLKLEGIRANDWFGVPSPGVDTAGTVRYRALVYYVDGMRKQDLDTESDWRPGNVEAAGSLPSMEDQGNEDKIKEMFAKFKPIGKPVKHEIWVTWTLKTPEPKIQEKTP